MSTAAQMTLAHINTQRVGVAFTIYGTYQLTTDPETLQVKDDNTTVSVTTSFTPGISGFSFVHPGFHATGTYTITVLDHVTSSSVVSNQFQVVPYVAIGPGEEHPPTVLSRVLNYVDNLITGTD